MGSLWIIITAFEVISRNVPKFGETECAGLTILNSPPHLCSTNLSQQYFKSFRFNLLAHCTLHCPIANPMGGIITKIQSISGHKARA